MCVCVCVCVYIYIYWKQNEKKQSWSKFYLLYLQIWGDKGNNKNLANTPGILAEIWSRNLLITKRE